MAVLILAGCGGEVPSTPAGSTAGARQPIVITSGRGIVDTIDAVVYEPITANAIYPGGSPRANTLLSVDFLAPNGAARSPLDPPVGIVSGLVATDASGNASITLKLGVVAGRWILRLSDPRTGDSDTLSYTVSAGRPSALALAPQDTAVYLTGFVRVASSVTDRHGNLTSGSVAFSSDSGTTAADVQPDGRVTGLTPGRARVRAQLTGTSASTVMRVSVVPQGVVAADEYSPFATNGVAMFNLDGSGFHLLALGDGQYNFPSWSPDGAAIAYNVGLPGGLLYRVDTNGVVTKLSTLGTMLSETWPRYSPDGQFIYFTGGNYPDSLDTYRIRADGTGSRVRVTPPRPPFSRYWKASPSPDGTQLAYSDAGVFLHVYNLLQGTDRLIQTANHAESPRFSPDGQWIAFADDISHSIKVVRPDGSGLRPVTPSKLPFDKWGHDWSPDGVWIIGSSLDYLWIVRFSDGLSIPLPYSQYYTYPTWRPR
jgi:hypothetical protein